MYENKLLFDFLVNIVFCLVRAILVFEKPVFTLYYQKNLVFSFQKPKLRFWFWVGKIRKSNRLPNFHTVASLILSYVILVFHNVFNIFE